jgi:RND family efflux transporter MFP subunit
MKKFWLHSTVATVTLGVAVTLFVALTDKQQPQAFATVRVDTGPVTSYIRATGRVSSVHDVRLGLVSGGLVQAVNVSVGSVVEPRQELLRLDSRDTELQLVADEAAMREIDAGIAHQERSLLGLRADHAAGAVSREQVLRAQENIALARIQRQKAAARVALARARLQQSTLRSPIAGVVTDVSMQPGEMAVSGQPLITVSDTADQQILARMEQDDAQDLRVDMPVRVSLPGTPEQLAEERILRIEPAVRKEGNTGYTAVWISLSSSKLRLRPNQQVDVRVPIGSHVPVPRLPLEALSTYKDKTAVWTLDDRGALRPVPITTGVMGDRFVEILSGLAQGQVAVLAGGRTLKEGEPARAANAAVAP